MPDEERRNTTKLYNKMTVGDLATKWPSIPWLDYINRLLSPYHKIDGSEPVIVDVPSYITEFEKLIAATPKRYDLLIFYIQLKALISLLECMK